MKIGKVFEKLAAHKNCEGILFGEKFATVTLTDGSSLICKSAHEARLFIEQGKQPNGSLVEVPAPTKVTAIVSELEQHCGTEAANNVAAFEAAFDPAPAVEAVAACGTEAPQRLITLDADYVRIRGGGLVEVPYNAHQVRVTAQQAAALIAGGFDF